MSDKFKYTVGLNNVGSYQVAGSPYVTASTIIQGTEQEIQFPRVTNNLEVRLDHQFNSVEVKGINVYYQNTNNIAASDGDNRTITTWISASNSGSGGNNGIIIAGTTANNQFVFKEKNGNYQAQLRDQTSVKTINISNSFFTNGWVHLALVASSSAYFNVLINGDEKGTVAIATTEADYLGGGLVLGPPGNGETDLKFRDAILWDTALSNAEVLALYQASSSYSDPAFSAANKLIWVRPYEAIAETPVNSLRNAGDISYGNMALNLYTAGETAQIVSDSPFNKASLRIHYRSTGSLPDVANNKHYWTLSSKDEKIKMNVKTKEVFLSAVDADCEYSLHADLTNIPASRMYQHTGSGVDE